MTTNPALAELEFLAGDWDMELYDTSFLPDPDAKVRGQVTFAWIEQDTALVMRMGPAIWIIGRDDAEPHYHVLYADERGVSRVYRMSLDAGAWRIWRDTPEFSQRFDAEVDSGHAEINGAWQKSTDGGKTWEHDFKVRYSRQGPR